MPQPKENIPRKTVAKQSRQKLASVPPIMRDVRLAKMAENENKTVVNNAAPINWQCATERQMLSRFLCHRPVASV